MLIICCKNRLMYLCIVIDNNNHSKIYLKNIFRYIRKGLINIYKFTRNGQICDGLRGGKVLNRYATYRYWNTIWDFLKFQFYCQMSHSRRRRHWIFIHRPHIHTWCKSKTAKRGERHPSFLLRCVCVSLVRSQRVQVLFPRICVFINLK